MERLELSILITGDSQIQRINKKWRGKNLPTDVLSFPQLEPAGLRQQRKSKGEWLLGDVVISIDTAKRQAKENGLTVKGEVKRLLVHGILHLFGYDHEKSQAEARRMRRLERSLLTP